MELDNKVDGSSGVSDLPAYIEAIADNIEAYSQNNLSPGQIQTIMGDLSANRALEVQNYFESMVDAGLLEVRLDGGGKMPDIYSITEVGKEVLEDGEHKIFEGGYWAGTYGNRLMVCGPENGEEIPYMSSDAARANFSRFDEDEVETLLEN